MVGLFVFGEIDDQTGCSYETLFEAEFNKEKCLDARQNVGAALPIRVFLNPSKVSHQVGVIYGHYPFSITKK